MKALLILLSIIILALGTNNYANMPVMMSSNLNMGSMKEQMFGSQQTIIESFIQSIPQDKAMKIIVFEVLTPHTVQDTISIIRAAKEKMPSFNAIFKNQESSFITTYLKYSSEAFIQQLIDLSSVKENQFEINTNFLPQHHKFLQQEKSSIEHIRAPLAQIEQIEITINKDLQILQQQPLENAQAPNYCFLFLFNLEYQNLKLLQEEQEEALVRAEQSVEDEEGVQNKRNLQEQADDDPFSEKDGENANQQLAAAAANNSGQLKQQISGLPTNQQCQVGYNQTYSGDIYGGYYLSNILPSSLLGYLVSIFLLVALYYAVGVLLSLETPSKFPKIPMLVGKES